MSPARESHGFDEISYFFELQLVYTDFDCFCFLFCGFVCFQVVLRVVLEGFELFWKILECLGGQFFGAGRFGCCGWF